MSRFVALVAGALCLYVSTLPATAQRTNNTIYGAGNHSCGEWVQNIDNDIWRGAYTHWLFGFVTGTGYVLDTEKPPTIMRRTDHAGMLLFMDNYCRSNPLRSVQDGSAALVKELSIK